MEFTRGAAPDGRPTFTPPPPCLTCVTVVGTRDAGGYRMYHDDGDHLVGLAPGAAPRGLSVVVPRRHVEDLVDGLTVAEYLAAQELVHRVATAVKRVVSPANVIVSSMGGLPGNPHIMWSITPMTLPSVGPDGAVAMPQYTEPAGAETTELAERLAAELAPRKA